MNIYEIDQAIANLVDPETGEIQDFDAFAELQISRETKLENMALWVKDLTANAKAIRDEELALSDRRRALESKAESLKDYLTRMLNGEKFSTPKVVVSYRKSAAVEIEDENRFVELMKAAGCVQYLTAHEPTINKTAIAAALKSGAFVPGANLVERQNIQIR